MTAPPLEDPFEKEHVLVRGPRAALAFSPRALELPPEELVRWLGVELVAGVPRELGQVRETFPGHVGDVTLAARFFAVGPALGVVTDVTDPSGDHRVIEFLGVRGDARARMNVARVRVPAIVGAGRSEPETLLGNVRAWGGQPGQADRAIASVLGHVRLLGLEPSPSARAAEPEFLPPGADRVACEPETRDARVIEALVDLLRAHPAAGFAPRAPRRISELDERVKRPDGSLVALRYEVHRAGTGVLHVRRREVEAGSERPALVRTWNVAGLTGGTRVRIRDVAGRATAELGGSREGVARALEFLEKRLGARR